VKPSLHLIFWGLGIGIGITYADGYRNPPPDTQALSRSGAGYTLPDSPGVLAYTPARILALEDHTVSASAAFASTSIRHHATDGLRTENRERSYVLPAFFATAVLGPDVSGGLALISPYGQGTEYARDTRFAAIGPYRAELAMAQVSGTLAWRAHPKVWLAATADMYTADLTLKQHLDWTALGAPAGTPPGQAAIEADDQALGGTLSASVHPAGGHVLTATWRNGPDLKFRGDARVSPPPIPVPLTPRSDAAATLRFPDLFALSYGVQLHDKVQAEVFVEWIEWSRNQEIDLDLGANQALAPAPIANAWKDTVCYGVGLTWQVRERLALHAGYAFLQSPVPDSTLGPLLPDADRHALSLGLSWLASAHRVHAGVSLGFAEDRTLERPGQPALSGTWETTPTLWGVSYAYHY